MISSIPVVKELRYGGDNVWSVEENGIVFKTELIKQCKDDPQKLSDRLFKRGHALKVVTQRFLDFYKAEDFDYETWLNEMSHFDGHKFDQFEDFYQAINTIEDGHYERIVMDNIEEDGFLYDSEGNPIKRNIPIDCVLVRSRVDTEEEYEKLIPLFQTHTQVINFNQWNKTAFLTWQSQMPNVMFTCLYKCTDEEWNDLIKKMNNDSYSSLCSMTEIIIDQIVNQND